MLFDYVYVSSDNVQMACYSFRKVFQDMITSSFYRVLISDISRQGVNVEYPAR